MLPHDVAYLGAMGKEVRQQEFPCLPAGERV